VQRRTTSWLRVASASLVFDMSAMAGEGRTLVLPSRYPVATRIRRGAKSFGNPRGSTRFGTEGSEVQILSPRPFPKKVAEFSLPVHSVPPAKFPPQNRVLGPSNHTPAPNCSKFLTSVGEGSFVPRTLGDKVLPIHATRHRPPTPTRDDADPSVDRVMVTMTSSRRSEQISGSHSTSRASALLVGGEDRPIPFVVPRTTGRVSASIRDPDTIIILPRIVQHGVSFSF
jgi:hypothetical protein